MITVVTCYIPYNIFRLYLTQQLIKPFLDDSKKKKIYDKQ